MLFIANLASVHPPSLCLIWSYHVFYFLPPLTQCPALRTEPTTETLSITFLNRAMAQGIRTTHVSATDTTSAGTRTRSSCSTARIPEDGELGILGGICRPCNRHWHYVNSELKIWFLPPPDVFNTHHKGRRQFP